MTYRRKGTVEAIRFSKENVGDILRFAPETQISYDLINECYSLRFKFKKTSMVCEDGDYIMRTDDGFAVVKMELFEEEYENAE